jgi:hypothetical protein
MSGRREREGGNPAHVLPQARVARTAAAVAAAGVTTSGGHLLGTGAPAPLTGVLLALALTTVASWWLTRDERGWERLAVAQLGAQLGGHALFVGTATDPAVHAGHGVLGPELVLLVHVLGAAVSGAWLRCGERRAVEAARRAVAGLRRLLCRLLAEWRTARPPARRRRVDARARVSLTPRLRHSIVHRGPPAVC